MKQILATLACWAILGSPTLAQESPHSVWTSAGIGGSWAGGFPVAVGYAYQFNQRVALLGTIQRTAWTEKSVYAGYEYHQRMLSLGVGIRLYTKPEKLLNNRIVPFFDLNLAMIDQKSDLGYYSTTSSPLPFSLSFGCLFAPAASNGLFAKMNLGTLSLIDLGYTYHFN